MGRPTVLTGRIWLLVDSSGRLIDDIDTDMIYHNRHLHITDVAQMGQYALGNLQGWTDFASRARPGDIVIAGANFGSGSSRQQAVDCFRALSIGAVIAESFGAIYKRNAINSGLPILVLPGGHALAAELADGDDLRVDLVSGELLLNGARRLQAEPFSQVQMDIYQAGDLFAYGEALEQADAAAGAR